MLLLWQLKIKVESLRRWKSFFDLQKSGVINKKQIVGFEALKSLKVADIKPKAIKQLRIKNGKREKDLAAPHLNYFQLLKIKQ